MKHTTNAITSAVTTSVISKFTHSMFLSLEVGIAVVELFVIANVLVVVAVVLVVDDTVVDVSVGEFIELQVLVSEVEK